jgi:hypothetical protein
LERKREREKERKREGEKERKREREFCASDNYQPVVRNQGTGS